MAAENVAKFEELLRSDEALQAKLRGAMEAYAGNKADDQAIFDAVIAPLAAEAGLPFTYEEGTAYVNASRELDDAELNAVAGGGWCYIIGGADDEAEAWACTTFSNGAIACYYVGISLMERD